MTRSPLPPRWLPSTVSRLGVKIAGPVALLSALALGFVASDPLWPAMFGALGLGGAAYALAHYWVHARLNRLQETLERIHNQAFDELSSPPRPDRDELSLVRRDAYRTGQSLETDIRKLKERENYRREFIGNVAHELKTPIFSVQGFTETLLAGALEDEEVNRTFLHKILRNVHRLENLARDVSAITKIETGEMEMSRDELDVQTVFHEVQESLELKADENSITLQTTVDENLPVAYGDRDRIRRVIVNLADNAIKYNEPGGTVLLKATGHPTDEVQISVEDDGIGIPSEHLSRLTERFYRIDKSRSRNQGGTGLGLAIVKHILRAHNQELQIESTPGEGSRFRFRLPTTPGDFVPAA